MQYAFYCLRSALNKHYHGGFFSLKPQTLRPDAPDKPYGYSARFVPVRKRYISGCLRENMQGRAASSPDVRQSSGQDMSKKNNLWQKIQYLFVSSHVFFVTLHRNLCVRTSSAAAMCRGSDAPDAKLTPRDTGRKRRQAAKDATFCRT